MTSQWEAFVVGINYYPSFTGLSPLTAAANDAEAIAAQLEQYGYQSFRVQRLPRQANQKGEWQVNPDEGVKGQELAESLRNLLTPPDNNPPETALFFFSGHGWQKSINGKDEVFLATSDALPNKEIYGVTMSSLGQLIQESQAKRIIVWLDCCFSGELTKYLPDNKDYCIFTATRSYEPAIEIKHREGLFTQTLPEGLSSDNYTGGLFTQALLEGLNPEHYADGIVDSHKLAKFIQERMAQTGQAPQCFNSVRSILLTSKASRKAFINECPYRSLFYFSESLNDAQVFHGRTKLTQVLVEHIRKQERLIAVFGASGSGKSSLIRAGLLYQLKLGQAIPGSNNWIYLEPFPPTNDPLTKFYEVIEKTEELAPIFRELKESKGHNSEGQEDKLSGQDLVEFFQKVKDDKSPIVIIIDQFEECFTMGDQGKTTEFITLLTDLVKTLPNLYLIIGMRSDFRGRLREFPAFSQAIIAKINVEHLNRAEIEEAIAKPAEFVGLGIESSLKQQLINDVEDYPGSLPLLQYTLTELWNEARKQGEQFLRLETYTTLGGIEGTLEKRADAAYENLPEAEQTVAKRIFLELTQVGDTFDTRRRLILGDLVNSHHSLEILDKVTEKLANKETRLITRTEAEKAEDTDESKSQNLKSKIVIDVVHEALIRHWKLLGDWKQEYQTPMVIERKIEEAAQEWEEKGKKNEYLLQGARLATAEDYLKSFGNLGMLDGIAEGFITVSHQHKNVVRCNWVAGILAISLTLLGLTAYSLNSATRAYESEREAIESEKKAIDSAKQARESEKKAIDSAKQAKESKQKAIISARLAESRRIQAEEEKKRAEIALDKARKAEYDAMRSKKDALISAKDAKEQTKLAEARRIAAQNALILAEDKAKEARDSAEIAKRQTLIAKLGEQAANVKLLLPVKPIEGLILAIQTIGTSQNLLKNVTSEAQGSLLDAIDIARERNLFKDDQSEISSVALSPDNQIVVTGNRNGTLRLWTISGKPLSPPFKGHKGYIESIVFSPDGKFFLSSSEDNTVHLWNTSGNPQPFKGQEGFSVAFSRDGDFIVSGGKDGILRLWDRSGQLIGQPFKAHKEKINSVAFSPDNNFVVSGSGDQTVGLWDISNKHAEQVFKESKIFREHRISVISVAFSSDGQYIISSDDENKVVLRDKSGDNVKLLKGYAAAFSPNSQAIVTGNLDKTIRFWDTSANPIGQILKGHNGDVFYVTFNSDGKFILSKDFTEARLWDAIGHLKLSFLTGLNIGVNAIAFSPDNKTIVTSYFDSIQLWDVQGKAIGKPFRESIGNEGNDISLAFSPNGKIIASSNTAGTIRLWDASGNLIGSPLKGPDDFNYIAFGSDNKTLVVGGGKTIQLWDVSGKPIGQPFQGQTETVSSIAFSSDNKTIVSGDRKGIIRFWDTSGKLIAQPLKGHEGDVNSLAFSPDSKTVASAGKDGTVRLWNLSGKPIGQPFKGHENAVKSVAFSPDGQLLLSGSDDGTVRLWDRAGKAIGQPKNHGGWVGSVAFSPDGKTIISGGYDGVRVWQGGTWRDWLAVGCDRLRLHPVFTSPAEDATEQEKMIRQGAIKTCLDYGGWSSQQKAEFPVR